MRCTKISVEFEFGGQRPRGAHVKMWRSTTTLGKSARVVYKLSVLFFGSVDTWSTLITNSRSVFVKLRQNSENRLVSHLCMLGL